MPPSRFDPKYRGLPERVCKKCGAPYPEHRDFFGFTGQDGRYMRNVCAFCQQVYFTEYRNKRREFYRAYNTEYGRAWRAKNPERYRIHRARQDETKKRKRVSTFKKRKVPLWAEVRQKFKDDPSLWRLSQPELAVKLKCSVSTIYRAQRSIALGYGRAR